jgi:hypothetical protein
MFWIGLIIGLFIGSIVGIMTAALCTVAGAADRNAELYWPTEKAHSVSNTKTV